MILTAFVFFSPMVYERTGNLKALVTGQLTGVGARDALRILKRAPNHSSYLSPVYFFKPVYFFSIENVNETAFSQVYKQKCQVHTPHNCTTIPKEQSQMFVSPKIRGGVLASWWLERFPGAAESDTGCSDPELAGAAVQGCCAPSHAAECSSAVQPQQRGAAVAGAACSSSRPEAAAEYAWSRLQPTLQPSEAPPWVWPQTEAAAWMEACNAPAGLLPPCSAAHNLQLLCHAPHSTAITLLRRRPLPLFQTI